MEFILVLVNRYHTDYVIIAYKHFMLVSTLNAKTVENEYQSKNDDFTPLLLSSFLQHKF